MDCKCVIILIIIFLIIYNNYNLVVENILLYNNPDVNSDQLNNIYTDIVCLIAMWGRQELVQINIDCLKKQTKVPKIVLVVSNDDDKEFAIRNNVHWVYTDNQPLGKKWQIGLEECKKFNPNAVLINGSDDILSLNYVKNCYKYIKNGYDVVGKNNWYILDLLKVKPYKLQYTNKNLLIGAGRMISRSFLDEINWTLFPLTKSSGLDSYCNQIFEKNNASLFEMGTNNLDKIISLKGKQDMLNPLEKILKATNKITILPISNNINVNMTNLGKYINNYELNKIAVLLE